LLSSAVLLSGFCSTRSVAVRLGQRAKRDAQALGGRADAWRVSPRAAGLLIIGIVDVASVLIAIYGSPFFNSVYIVLFALAVTVFAVLFTRDDQ
jgi:hypothetical protein